MSNNLKFMEMNYREVSCQKAVNATNFSQGLQDFNWSVGYPVSWIPSCTYMRMTVQVNRDAAGGNAAPQADTVTPADDHFALAENCANNLYNNVYLRAGQQDISSIINYSAQASMLKHRITKPGALLTTVGKSVYMLDADFRDRQLIISQLDAQGSPQVRGYNRNVIDIIFQPGALGIWDYNNVMPSGDYRLSLNPATQMLFAIQGDPTLSGYNGGTVPITFGRPPTPNAAFISVLDVKLYLCTVRVTESISEQVTFNSNLPEYFVAQKPLQSGSNTYDYTVPSSTYMLGFFIQSGTAGVPVAANVPNYVALSTFTTQVQDELRVTSYQMTYANQTKPSTKWSTEYTGNPLSLTGVKGLDILNKYQSRYFNNLVENDLYMNPGGAETLNEFLVRGPFFLHSFIRDKDDKSTQVQLSIDLGVVNQVGQVTGPDVNAQVFLVAIYNRETEIKTEKGRIQSVRSLNT